MQGLEIWRFGFEQGLFFLYIYIYISILVLVIFSAFDTLLLEGGILLNYMLVILVGLNISIWLCLSVFDISEGILGFI